MLSLRLWACVALLAGPIPTRGITRGPPPPLSPSSPWPAPPLPPPKLPFAQLPQAYFIGVYGFGAAASYSLLATVRGVLPHLLDGQLQYGSVAAHALTLFEFDVPSQWYPPIDVEISVTVLSGTAQLFTLQRLNPDNTNVLPTLNCSTYLDRGA
jgi:hypothetical protein